MGRKQLQLNMHNDKNVGFMGKWEVKLLTEKKKKVIIQCLDQIACLFQGH